MAGRTRFLFILLCLAGIVILWNIDHKYFAVPITVLGGVAMWLATTPIRIWLTNRTS